MPAKPRRIVRLRVQLLEVSPPIWRRLEVRADSSFWALHLALQNVMGWTDSHLHDFELPAAGLGEPVWIGMPDEDGIDSREIRLEEKERLADWLHAGGERFFYNYDYGDGWRHEVVVEALEAAATRLRYPRCVGGARACPPEDCGGPHGYAELLAALADPEHEQHEELSAWIGKRFDPERFAPASVHFPNPARRLLESYAVD